MKKALVILSIIFLLLPITVTAQSFDALWQQVNQAEQKDLPKTQISLLKKIEQKAQKEKAYGQILAASLLASRLQTEIAPDSAEVELKRLKAKAKMVEGKDEVLSAVYNCVLGVIGRNEESGNADDYFKKALANPSLLASQKAADFKPLIKIGKNDDIFKGDLLHVIGMQVGNYDKLHSYYKSVGNREAACYTALMGIKEEKESISKLDSLMQVYSDLPICGEVAIQRYLCMGKDTPVEKKIAYIDDALVRWASWKRIVRLRNIRMSLTEPKFDVHFDKSNVSSSEKNNWVRLNTRNVSDVIVTVTRTKLSGNHSISFGDKDDMAKLMASLLPATKQTINRTFTGHKDYEEVKDSFLMPTLPLGVYLIKIESPEKNITPEYAFYYVSDLYVMSELQPKKKARYVVVNVVDGQPVANATVQATYPNYYGKAPIVKKLVTNKNGEVVFDSERTTPDIYVFTNKDKAFEETQLEGSYDYDKENYDIMVTQVFTDRGIYRPGQTVHASVIA